MAMHPAVNVKEVLRLAMPKGTYLAAGNANVDILWVRRTRVQPPAFLNLEPGELVLLSTETLRLVDERLTLDRVIESLAGVGIAAIGVQGEIDQAAIDQAEVFDLPLLVLPDAVSLLEVERTVTRLLIDREAQIERRAQEIAELLAALATENRGLEAILQAVTDTTGKVAVIHNLEGEPVVYTALGGVPSLPIAEVETALRSNGTGAVVASGYTVPLVVEGHRAGYLTILNGGVFDDLDRMTAGRGAMVCAMELAKQKAVVDAETRVRGDWMQRWLSGDAQQDETELVVQATEAGLVLSKTYMAALYRAGEELNGRAADLLRREMASRRIQGVIGQTAGGALLLFPVETVPRALHVLDALRELLAEELETGVACGIGQPARGLGDLRKSHRQAERALQMGQELCGQGCTMYFGNLSLYRLLLSVEDTQDLKQFCEDTIGPALAYDERYEGELVRTLEAFFANNGNLARTAEELCVHRNTLNYRLSRVSEITGLEWEDPDNRLMLNLALKVQRVIHAVD